MTTKCAGMSEEREDGYGFARMIENASACVSFLPSSLGTPLPIARAEVPLDGSFVAGENCSAFQSIRKQSNPVRLETGHSYQIVAATRKPRATI